jgi:glutamate-1-semialdehyde aminotransferase/spore coat polysaccharide biosynthesis protein SpsF (cytidylyltransferase family)
MTKTVAVVQARMGSTRLPGKVMIDIAGRPTIEWVVEAARRAPGVDEVIVATSTLSPDDVIAQWASKRGINVVRGDETDVLSRYLAALSLTKADIIVRLTADCPFLDPTVIGEVIRLRQSKGVDYATNTDPPTYPDGLDVEVITRSALETANREAVRSSDRDTVTRFIVRNRHRFHSANAICPCPNLVAERWVLDSPEDLEFVRAVAARLGDTDRPPSYLQILSILDQEPWIRKLNDKYSRNERFYQNLASEKPVKRTYNASKLMLTKAESLIPLGAQTFSKSKLMFPIGAAPLFVTHGDGPYVFDVDGNDYIDCVGALLPNILGYRDPDVDAAIRDQLNNGISFSVASPIEELLACTLHQHIPSAEMVRFGKNGSDVTTAAIRLARHITGRDDVLVGGYHGWHDWSMAVTERCNGIPDAIKELSLKPDEGGSLDGPPKRYAAWIVEPEFFTQGQLQQIRNQCNDFGSILIFDEIITGFRCGLGGLQAIHGVTPDLSCFGKAMGNGMPISALVGLEKYMKRMPEISYSGTFFGETLSIAAAIATIDKLEVKDVHRHLKEHGEVLRFGVEANIKAFGLEEYISLYGLVELNRIKFKNNAIQTLFIQEMAKNGVLIIGSHNLSYAHTLPQITQIIKAWTATLTILREAVHGDILQWLDGDLVTTKGVR